MSYWYLAGRVLFVLIFITAAPRHFTHGDIQHALGVPVAAVLVAVSGLMAIAGGLSIAAGYKTRWGAWLLVAFLLPVTLTMHAYWKLHDRVQIRVQQAMFAKNISMLGAALLLTQFGAGPVSVDARNP